MLEPTEHREWFVSQGKSLEGPFTAERIRDLIRWGRISERAYLCDEYHSAWIPIRQSALARVFAEEQSQRAGGAPPDAPRTVEPGSHLPKAALVAAALALAAIVGVLAD